MRWQIIIAGLAFLAGAVFLASRTSCRPEPTKVERRADSVLAEVPAHRKLRAERDSARAAWQAVTKQLRVERRAWRDSVQMLQQDVDREAVAATTLAEIPSGISQSDSIVALSTALHAQTKVAARLRTEVVPALERVIRMDSLTIWRQDATIQDQALSLRDEYRRNDALTSALSDLRGETKDRGSFNVLGLRFPSWTDEALMIAGASYVAYKLGKSS